MNSEVPSLETTSHTQVFQNDPIGAVFALGIEAASLVDRMKNVETSNGNGLTYHRGMLGWKRFVLVESGVGRKKARQAVQALHEVFQPNCILSAGFAGALDPSLHHNIVIHPKDIRFENHSLPVSQGRAMTLLTCDHLVDTVKEKQRMYDATGANLVDMESYAVAEFCREKHVPFVSIRIVFDVAGEELAKELRGVANPNAGLARKAGTLAGAFFRRPSSLLDLLKYKERALVSADRLAADIEKTFLGET